MVNRTCGRNFGRNPKSRDILDHENETNLQSLPSASRIFYLAIMMKSEIVWDESHQLLGTGWSKLPDESRVWLHLANRVLSDEELVGWAEAMEGFLSNWTAHGQGLRASWSLFGRRLLVVGLDESLAGATGCSIDQLMRLIQSEGMGLTPPVDWLTRTHTLYKGDGIWRELDLHAFWAA